MSLLPSEQDPNVTEKRHQYVGGSDVPTILGINKYKTQFELAQEKVGIKPSDFEGNEYTHFGNVMEPQIRDYINIENETDFRPETKVDEEIGIRSNTDGLYENIILEIKTHGKNPTRRVYEAQMQMYMYQFDVTYGWLAMYERPDDFDTEFEEHRLSMEVVERDNAMIQKILDAIETFWIRCEFLKENPEATENDFLNYGQNEVAEIAQKVEALESKLAEYKELEKQHKDMKAQLYDAMEAYDIKKFETDHITITRVLPTKAQTFDKKKFKEDYPELHDEYQKESNRKGSVRINMKEAK